MSYDKNVAADKVVQYKAFYHERLKPDLDCAIQEHRAIEEELGQYQELLKNLKRKLGAQEEVALISLGAEVFSHYTLTKPEEIFMYVGLGFYLQCSVTEGSKLAEDRVVILQRKKEKLDTQISDIRDNIDLVSFCSCFLSIQY